MGVVRTKQGHASVSLTLTPRRSRTSRPKSLAPRQRFVYRAGPKVYSVRPLRTQAVSMERNVASPAAHDGAALFEEALGAKDSQPASSTAELRRRTVAGEQQQRPAKKQKKPRSG